MAEAQRAPLPGGPMQASGHAQRMNRMYRNQRHIYDLTRRYYLLGRDRLIADLDLPEGGQALEIGCGTGRNLVLAAQAHRTARFFGMDISDEMLVSARQAAQRKGLANRIIHAQGDAVNFDPVSMFGVTSFDCIFMSYTLSMIPCWQEAIEHALPLLSPGGSLHVVDFGQQERMPSMFRRLLFTWLGWFHVSPRAALHSVLQAAAHEHGCNLSFRPLFRGYACHAVVTRS